MIKTSGLAILAMTVALLGSCATTSGSAVTTPAPGDGYKGRAAAIVKGGTTGAPGSATAASPTSPGGGGQAASSQAGAAVPTVAAGDSLSPDEQAFLQSYLGHLNYMVYYNDAEPIDPRLARIAVRQANQYLLEKEGLSVIDFDQIEKNKKDQAAAWQAETGGSVSMVQYLAQKFNADVYVELSFTVQSEMRDSYYYATTSGTAKIFDVSTAALLGSVAYPGDKAFSPNSMDAALTNAVGSWAYLAMPRMLAQAKGLLQTALQRGIRFELNLQNTKDAKAVSAFRRALGGKLREVEQLSYSPEETRFYLYGFLSRDKVQDAIEAAAQESGLRDLYPVLMRGKSFTYNTGS
jgi:hypothetical protein